MFFSVNFCLNMDLVQEAHICYKIYRIVLPIRAVATAKEKCKYFGRGVECCYNPHFNS